METETAIANSKMRMKTAIVWRVLEESFSAASAIIRGTAKMKVIPAAIIRKAANELKFRLV